MIENLNSLAQFGMLSEKLWVEIKIILDWVWLMSSEKEEDVGYEWDEEEDDDYDNSNIVICVADVHQLFFKFFIISPELIR